MAEMAMGGLAVVTGGAGGIGMGIVSALRKQGVADRVAVLDIAPTPLELDATTTYTCDVTDEASVREAIEAIGETPTVLVNNAGGSPRTLDARTSNPADPFGDVARWRAIIDLNLTAAHVVTSVFGPRLTEGAAICNVASIAGMMPSTLFAYSAAKAGLIHWTRCLAVALAPQRIRVNAVAPGIVYTEQLRRLIPQREAFENFAASAVPLGREQTAEEVGEMVAFLCSDHADSVTGQILGVDGGASLGKPPAF